jgi:uncharacterized membrane protein
MRNLIIAIAVIAGLVLIGIGAKYGWDLVRRPIADAGIDAGMAGGKMNDAMRNAYIKSSTAACEKQRPATLSEDAFNRACVCISEKSADLITAQEARTINDTSEIPDSLKQKLQEPIKECAKEAGLVPAQ